MLIVVLLIITKFCYLPKHPITSEWKKVMQYISPEIDYSAFKKEYNPVSFETMCESGIY